MLCANEKEIKGGPPDGLYNKGTWSFTRLDELLFEICRSRRISKSSSSRRETRLVPVFILQTDNRVFRENKEYF